MQCKETAQCIFDYQVCDGTIDCTDESDENYCSEDKVEIKTKCYHECSDGKCVEQSQICNGVMDCSDHSDEVDCADTNADTSAATCDINNGGCDQICDINDHGVTCRCNPGYHLENSSRCLGM